MFTGLGIFIIALPFGLSLATLDYIVNRYYI